MILGASALLPLRRKVIEDPGNSQAYAVIGALHILNPTTQTLTMLEHEGLHPGLPLIRLILSGLIVIGTLALTLYCTPGTPYPIADLDPTEHLPGGATTNTLLMGSNAFIRPARNLSDEHEAMFYSGNSWFNQSWVEAPASAITRDGLGPLYNATSCSSCHFKDGRGKALEPEINEISGVLFRISIPGEMEDGSPMPDPVYGDQLQDFGIRGVPGEGTIHAEWEERPGQYDDGTPYSLRHPTYSILDPQYGAPSPDLMISPRVAPHVIGMGLLEAIRENDLLEIADENDADGDGISGKLNRVPNVLTGEMAPGRFGWKAEQPTVVQQASSAFSGDVGITTPLFPNKNCSPTQSECLDANEGGEPEFPERLLDRVDVYTQSVAVPVRRVWDTDEILRGKLLFNESGCASCHHPSYETGNQGAIEEMHHQKIWPYTDLLLHDMGAALADNRPSFLANGQEWRTPPLWGLGLVPTVNKHNHLLHDGRARGFAEAILWHGGEAESAQEAFKSMPSEDRDFLIQFLESL